MISQRFDRLAPSRDRQLEDLKRLLDEPLVDVSDREKKSLERLLSSCGGRIVLIGAGSTGRRAIAALRGIGVVPLAVADNDRAAWGTSVEGLPVIAPADAAAAYGTSAAFIVTIWNAKHWFSETKAQLENLGCTRVEPVSSVYWRFPQEFLPFFSEDLPHKVYAEKDDVLRAAAIWADDQSLAEYRAHVLWRTQGDFGGLPPKPKYDSYFSDDLFELMPGEHFVDCGAYDGDTIASVVARLGSSFERIDAIEPASDTFRDLGRYVSELSPDAAAKIVLHRCAVGAKRGTVYFDALSGLDAHVSEFGDFSVEQFTLDELFADVRPSYIKMDIEGAEYDALLGARTILKRDRPVLAICVYHTQNDLWRLPLLIHDTVPEYRMFLRTYEGDGWQTVAYAIPMERLKEPA
jgi:FkbM family methyltransferase